MMQYPTSWTIADYQITEQVYESQNSLVYRGYRQGDQQPVMIKMLKLNDTTAARIKIYQHEYQLLQRLPIPGVVQPYAFETDQSRPFLVLEDFGGASLASLHLAGQLTLDVFLKLAIDLAATLGQVHAAHVIHKDINPNNIVYHPETGEVKLIDFSIATVLSREAPSFTNPNSLAGTLAYLSPEQSGRMNRAIDYRSDFYALGVTFYELLTGQLPFTSDDALALVHSHIAKAPTPPHERCEAGAIAPALSAIVLKLMAKNAEDRYQSAYGLQADLEHCRDQLTQHGEVMPFPLGRHEIRDQFHIPQKLYGREGSIETLLQGFERVNQGGSELLLITGRSGVGKSALIAEVHKPMTAQRGHFISGKFDQYQRDVPYFALSQAFNELCHQWLSERESILAEWRARILEAVGPNAQVLIDVIAKLEWLLGPQPPAPQVSPQEAQNRFLLVFRSLIQTLCQPAHPLVLFVDDLQWADSASLNLLKMLITDPESQYLLIIGAYRDHDVSPTHPLTLALEQIQQRGCRVSECHLDNLTLLDVHQLVAETLDTTTEAVAPLARLVYAKTQGNAFFTNEFFRSLYAEGLVRFCYAQRLWIWDIEAIEAKQITDNVVTFMAGKITDLDPSAQAILQVAACVGNTFDLQTLTLIAQQPPDIVQTQLVPALQEGLVITLNGNSQYKFQHDRVQQAAYSLIDAQQVKAIRLQIGRLLLANNTTNKLENLFEIVDHLNLARELITDIHELTELAALNLEASRKAQETAAYQATEDYAQLGIACLPDGLWDDQYDLAFTLHRQLAEAKQLQSEFQDSEALLHMLLGRAHTKFVKAELYYLLVMQYTIKNSLHQALDTGKKALNLLGVALPEDNNMLQLSLREHVQQIHQKLAGQSTCTWLDTPEATNPQQILIIRLLNSLLVPSYQTRIKNLYWLITLKIVEHSCEHGMVPESAYGFASYGMYLGSVLGDYRAGHDYGKLALELSIKLNHLDHISQVHFIFGMNIQPWVEPLHTSQPTFTTGMNAALASGMHSAMASNWFVGYFLLYKLLYTFFGGSLLKTVGAEVVTYLDEMRHKNHQVVEGTILAVNYVVARLSNLIKFEINEHEYENRLINQSDYCLSNYYILRCMVAYHFGNYDESLHYADQASDIIEVLSGKFQVAIHTFYHTLSLAALYPNVSPAQQQNYWDILIDNEDKLKAWATTCPENFEHQYRLVAAEIAALSGQHTEAIAFYDQAIDAAQRHGFMHQAALANERAAHYWLSQGKLRFAQLCLQEAHLGYQRWGANRLVVDLEQRYAPLFADAGVAPHADLSITATSTTSSGHLSTELDFASVFKASQALGREVGLETLLITLMHIAIENAGAERGVLLLHQDGQWLIQAEGTSDEAAIQVLQALPLGPANETTSGVCHGMINYVIRSRESIVLHDASRSGHFVSDPYVVQHGSKSVLCSPLLNQGNLVGIIYLENNLTNDVFIPERVQLLELLMTEAAISLENARLYSHLQTLNTDLEKRVDERTAQLQQAQQDLIAQAHRAGMADIAAHVLHNVGNVLNSVTTSATFIYQTVSNSQVVKLRQANNLVQQHADDLDAFVKTDPKAAKLLRYYELVAEQLQEEQRQIIGNINLLQDKIQLINEIVVAQQSYAQGGVLEETLVLEDVVELALTLQGASAERHDVTIERDYLPIAPVRAQKTKLVHVVVNLVKNAIEAMRGVEHHDKRLTLSIKGETDAAYLRIRDSGHGIAPQMLEAIFTHGTSTKPDGHGFGLHSSANYMTEMGGRLWAESAGEGRGATFIATLVYASPKDATSS